MRFDEVAVYRAARNGGDFAVFDDVGKTDFAAEVTRERVHLEVGKRDRPNARLFLHIFKGYAAEIVAFCFFVRAGRFDSEIAAEGGASVYCRKFAVFYNRKILHFYAVAAERSRRNHSEVESVALDVALHAVARFPRRITRVNHIRRRFIFVVGQHFRKVFAAQNNVVFAALKHSLRQSPVVYEVEIFFYAFFECVRIYVVVLELIDEFHVFGALALHDVIAFANRVGERNVRAFRRHNASEGLVAEHLGRIDVCVLVGVLREHCRRHFTGAFRKRCGCEFVVLVNRVGHDFCGRCEIRIHRKLRGIVRALDCVFHLAVRHRSNYVRVGVAHKFLAVLFALSVHRNGAFMRVFDTSCVKSVLDEKQFRRFLFDLVDTPTSYIKFG